MWKKKQTIFRVIIFILILIALFLAKRLLHEDAKQTGIVIQSNIIEVKPIYLTFDDGPTEYTEQILDVLEKYDIKATFFVTNQYPEYQDWIGEAYRRGHTIGLHSYSHDYSIYTCEETYYEDLERLNDIIMEQTGEAATIVRFPGGSSNCVSWNYCTGIMTCLVNGMEAHGYVYCDWNVDSLDSHGYLSAVEIAQTAISGIKKQDVSIVLMHDIGQSSVDAVEKIICWGLENGYTFLPMTNDMEMMHHSVVN